MAAVSSAIRAVMVNEETCAITVLPDLKMKLASFVVTPILMHERTF